MSLFKLQAFSALLVDLPLEVIPTIISGDLPVSRYADYLKSKYACKTTIEDDKRQYASRNAVKYINLAIIPNDNTDMHECRRLTRRPYP